jgi:peroxin-16
LSEFVFAASNLIVLINDRIILKEVTKGDPVVEKLVDYLELSLTTLEYCEVFIELSFRKLFGLKGKFLVITVVQILK